MLSLKNKGDLFFNETEEEFCSRYVESTCGENFAKYRGYDDGDEFDFYD